MTDTVNKPTRTLMTGPWAEGGRRMAELRLALEVTPSELAEQAGLPSAAWVADVEAGRRPVPSSFYKTLARQFGFTAAAFAAECLKHYDADAFEALFGAEIVELKVAA